jgi:hypothetical protein
LSDVIGSARAARQAGIAQAASATPREHQGTMPFDEHLARRIRKVLEAHRDLVEKYMFGGVCFMIRGRMVCGVVDTSLMVRLAPDEADRLADEPHARPMDFTGKPMRGFLFVDAGGLETPKSLRAWIDRAVAFVETMPPKPVTRQRNSLSTSRRPRVTTRRGSSTP